MHMDRDIQAPQCKESEAQPVSLRVMPYGYFLLAPRKRRCKLRSRIGMSRSACFGLLRIISLKASKLHGPSKRYLSPFRFEQDVGEKSGESQIILDKSMEKSRERVDRAQARMVHDDLQDPDRGNPSNTSQLMQARSNLETAQIDVRSIRYSPSETNRGQLDKGCPIPASLDHNITLNGTRRMAFPVSDSSRLSSASIARYTKKASRCGSPSAHGNCSCTLSRILRGIFSPRVFVGPAACFMQCVGY
jgi:hypothetical protein